MGGDGKGRRPEVSDPSGAPHATLSPSVSQSRSVGCSEWFSSHTRGAAEICNGSLDRLYSGCSVEVQGRTHFHKRGSSSKIFVISID